MCSALELSNTAVRAAGRAADAQELRGALCDRASAPSVLQGTRDAKPGWAPQPACGNPAPRPRGRPLPPPSLRATQQGTR